LREEAHVVELWIRTLQLGRLDPWISAIITRAPRSRESQQILAGPEAVDVVAVVAELQRRGLADNTGREGRPGLEGVRARRER
jgi:hypothetical protein